MRSFVSALLSNVAHFMKYFRNYRVAGGQANVGGLEFIATSSLGTGYELSFGINCSAGEKAWLRIIIVLSREVSPDDARIMAITTN